MQPWPANFGYVTAVPRPDEPFSGTPSCQKIEYSMAADSKPGKDTLKVEKASFLILILCVLVLVGILVFRPF